MKKFLSVLLVLCMAFFAVSCTQSATTQTPEATPTGTQGSSTPEPAELEIFAMKGPTGIGMAPI